MPRADDMPPIVDDVHPVPATTNPLGVKGVGEAGTTASLAAMMNAIANAIPGGGADASTCRRHRRKSGRPAGRHRPEPLPLRNPRYTWRSGPGFEALARRSP